MTKTKSTAVESKHTRTPWPEMTPPDPLGTHFSGAPSWIYVVGAATITMTFDDYAHARHCVNAHDGLVAALLDLSTLLLLADGLHGALSPAARMLAMKHVRAALAAAKGEN